MTTNLQDHAGRPVTWTVPISTKNGGLWSATANGAVYAEIPFDMEIDKVTLGLVIPQGLNTAGSGNFEVKAFAQGVAMWATDGLQVAYSSAHPYASIGRADLSVKSLTAGQELRIDVTEVFAGAATVYPDGANLTFVGVSN